MFTLLACLALLLPQGIAAQHRVGPAAHLTLLLLGLCAATMLVALKAISAQPEFTAGYPDTYYVVVSLSPLAYAVMGLAVLTPAFWIVEHIRPSHDFRIDVILIQTLALTMTAAFVAGSDSAPHALTEWGAVALTGVLALRAFYAIRRAATRK